jgi:WD40 repeat protein
MATAGIDGTARLWDLATGEIVQTFPDSGFVNYAIQFSPDGRQLAIVSGDVTLWDVATGSQTRRLQAEGVYYSDNVAFLPDGSGVLAVGFTQEPGKNYFTRWDAHSGVVKQHIELSRSTAVYGLDVSPDGRSAVLGGADPTLYWVDLASGSASGSVTPHFVGHTRTVSSARFAPDGLTLFTTSIDGSARLWDVVTGQTLRLFTPNPSGLFGAAFSPDGRFVAAAGLDGTSQLWETTTGQEVRRFIGHTSIVQNVAFTPDGRRLVTVSDDHTARVWDVNYHDTLDDVCARLKRDFSEAERQQYGLLDSRPTCPADG